MSVAHEEVIKVPTGGEQGLKPAHVDLNGSKSGCTARNVFCYRWWTPILWVLAFIGVAFAIAVPVLLKTKPWQADDPNFQFRQFDNGTYPFVSVEELVELMASEGGVTLLDARETPSVSSVQPGLNRNIPGFERARWTEFMDGDDLKSPEDMAQAYRDHGVYSNRPVVVYGGWAADNFWGEEGRVWWHLHWLNHPNARILYGGIWSWNSIHKGEGRAGEQGDFTSDPVAERLISTADVLETVQNSPNDTFIIDVRARNEYDGEAPFGSSYGGHIAGSFSYHWRQVFDNEGNLRPLETIRSELEALDTRGFDENRRFIAYCTRGIRASFGTAVFTAAGFDVEMYEGSWIEWTREVPQDVSSALQAAQG